MLILAENTEIMHLISTLISKNTSKTMHMQQTSRQKQLPYLHHCAHVLSILTLSTWFQRNWLCNQ